MSPYHPGMAQTTIWTGDPVWIADVLAAQGVKLVEYPGWRNRGHGNFKDNRRLSQTSARTIGHKEYAGRAQGKWDPGAIDMDILRADIQARIGTRVRHCADAAPTRSGRRVRRRPALPRFGGAAGRSSCSVSSAVDGRRRLRSRDRGGGEGLSTAHPRAEGGRHRRAYDRRCCETQRAAAQPATTDGGRRGVVSQSLDAVAGACRLRRPGVRHLRCHLRRGHREAGRRIVGLRAEIHADHLTVDVDDSTTARARLGK